jgi:hypothetical protein
MKLIAKALIYCLLVCLVNKGIGQISQVIRGDVKDSETQLPMTGVTLRLFSGDSLLSGAISDDKGKFRFPLTQVGRYTLHASFPGYKPFVQSNIILNSGKEMILNIILEESVLELETIEITDSDQPGGSNEMALNSTRSFQMEETERFAGSRSDAARMASNFAGVNGADDARNDISVRGNSPLGLLWRIEGVDVLNPNHFAVPGTTGGAISILNNKLFGTSDFFTGAFPAGYGNATAAVFDIRLRNGNSEKHEYSAQLGVLGTELAGEGPLSKNGKGSYLFAYRYSTLKLFESINIPIGTSAIPNYQDLSFKFNWDAGKAGIFSLWGISGSSAIRVMMSEKPVTEEDLYSESDWNQRFKTRMFVSGITHQLSISSKSFLRTTFAHYGGQAIGDHERFVRDSSLAVSRIFPKVYYDYRTSKSTIHSSYNHKFSARHTLKAGVILERFDLNYLDSNFVEPTYTWEYRNDFRGQAYMMQAYAQWKYKPSDRWVIQAGLHGQHFTLSESSSLEPRAGVKWFAGKKGSFSLSSGLHSQMLPLYIYVNQKPMPGAVSTRNSSYYLPKSTTGFSRSIHTVLGYDFLWSRQLFIRIETYYQRQYQIPVDRFPSAFSLLNQGTSFTRYFPDSLTNTGTGNNYGIELTINRSFSKGWYGLSTLSLYESNYKGSDQINRPTDLNGRFIWNALWGKEWKTGKKENRTISTAIKSTWGGGRRYTPADRISSDYLRELVEIDALTNTLQFRNYYRLDFRLSYRVNRPKVTHEIMIDVLNILNRKNILGLSYVPDPSNPGINPIREEYQLGRLPLFWYRLDF